MRYLFNMALLKEQLKRYWAIGALCFLAYFLCCLMPLWGAYNMNSAGRVMISILEMRHVLILFTNVLAPLAAVIAIFSYMYRQNSTGVIHSLPFTKMQLFATNVLTGYLLIIVPLAVFSALLLVSPITFAQSATDMVSPDYAVRIAANVFPNGLSQGSRINSLPTVAAFFARTLLSFTFYYALFITAAMIVGNQVIYFLVSGALMLLPTGFYLLFHFVAYYFVFGFVSNDELLTEVMCYSNPLAIGAMFTGIMSNAPHSAQIKSLATYYITYGVAVVGLITLSARLYFVRRLERAGDTVVFIPLKNFFIFVLAVTGLVSLGSFFLVMFGSITAMYVGFVIGFTLAFFIAQMIAEKSFNVFHKYRAFFKHSAVALGAFAVIVIVCKTDITGYSRYIPDAAEIDGVFLGAAHMFRNNQRTDAELDLIFVHDPDIINETTVLHENVIANRGALRPVYLSNLAANYRTGRTPVNYQYINYRLNDGSIIMREYVLPEAFYQNSGLERLMKREHVILSEVFWLNAPEYIDSFELSPYFVSAESDKYGNTIYQHKESIRVYEPAEVSALAAAMRKDYVNYRMNELWVDDAQYEGYRFNVQAYPRAGFSGGMGNYYVGLDYADYTLEWLLDNGYEMVGE